MKCILTRQYNNTISIVHLLFKGNFDNYSTNNELCGKPLKFLCGVYVSNDEI